MLNLPVTKPVILSFLTLWLFLFSESVYAILPVVDFAAIGQLGNQLTQLKIQTQSMQQELQTLSENQYQWSQVQPLLNEMTGILQKTRGLSLEAEQIDAAFKQSYPGYQPPVNLGQQYQTNVNTAQNTFNGVLKGLCVGAAHFRDENRELAFLQRQAQRAKGQTQAIQASSQIASELVSQLQLLHQTVMAQTHAQTAYYATQVQQEASSRAAFEQLIQRGSVAIPRYGSSPESLEMPEF